MSIRLHSSIRKLIPKSRFVRSAGVLASGTVVAQFLLIITSPLLTRLYTPDDFGTLAVYLGILSLVVSMASFRYELAIPLPDEDSVAVSLVILCLVIVLFVTGLFSGLLIFYGEIIFSKLNVPELTNYLWLFPFAIFFMSGYKVFNYWGLRTKEYPRIAKTKLSQAISMILIQIFGYKFGTGALLVGQAAGQSVGMLSLAKSFHADFIKRRWNWLAAYQAGKRYRKFPIYSTWGALFNSLGQQSPPILFAILFSSSAAGFYTLAHRVLAVPMSTIGVAIGQVFLSTAPQAKREGRLDILVSSVLEKLAQLALPPMLVLILAAPELFSLIFGDEWVTSGEFVRWMAPWLYVVFVTSPLSTLYEILEKQSVGMYFQIVLFLARIVSITIGAQYSDLLGTVVMFSMVSAVCWGFLLVWIVVSAGCNVMELWLSFIKTFSISCISLLPLIFGLYYFDENSTWLYWGGVSFFIVLFNYWIILRKAYS